MADRDARGRFIAGNRASKGNGRRKLSPGERTQIQALGEKALDVLESMLDSPATEDSVRARVAIFCAEKAFGKARQEIEHALPEDAMPTIVVRRAADG